MNYKELLDKYQKMLEEVCEFEKTVKDFKQSIEIYISERKAKV